MFSHSFPQPQGDIRVEPREPRESLVPEPPGSRQQQQSAAVPMSSDRDYAQDRRSYGLGDPLDHGITYSEHRAHSGLQAGYLDAESFSQPSGLVASVDFSLSRTGRPEYQHDPRGLGDGQYPAPSSAQSQSAMSSLSQLRTDDFTVGIDASMLMAPNMAYPQEPNSATTASSSHSSPGNVEPWSIQQADVQSEASSRPRKTRREKPQIELAPDQPPTTQGRPRARVYVACVQCRNRKIRCDGAKPVCHNCGRRTGGSSECNYDEAPKRRGPDKTPGARQRMARELREVDGGPGPKRRRRRKTEEATSKDNPLGPRERLNKNGATSEPFSQIVSLSVPVAPPSSHDVITPHGMVFVQHLGHDYAGVTGHTHGSTDGQQYFDSDQRRDYPPRALAQTAVLYPSYADGYSVHPSTDARRYSENKYNEEEGNTVCITAEPSLDFTRKTWWDSLLSLYTAPFSRHLQPLTHSQRDTAARSVASELRFIFRCSNYWFSFFHIPGFFAHYFDPVKRHNMQPSLVLSLLALATFFQSSEVEKGRDGRDRAFKFRDEAQGALEASFNGGWIDETLAQAAWVLAMFEVCAHPQHSSTRSSSAMIMLDSIIRSLSLTFLDADDPHVSVFAHRVVPTVTAEPSHAAHQISWTQSDAVLHTNTHTPSSLLSPPSSTHSYITSSRLQNLRATPASPPVGCSCASLSLGTHWASVNEHAPLWLSTPAWAPTWSEGDIRKESCRRLCWSTMMLAAGQSSYHSAYKTKALDLFVVEPANYALLFPGEALTRGPSFSPSHSIKESIWALYNRTMLLWHSCLRMRSDSAATDAEKSHFGVTAWLEADALEAALNRHTCGMERAFMFQGREYLFNVRMCISYEFQRYIPLATANVNGLFHRGKAEEWLSLQANVAKRVMQGLHTVTGQATNMLARRPFFVFWFMGQVSRALTLWECDNSLTIALDVSKTFLPPIDYLTALWPCPEQRARYEVLRGRLNEACYISGLPLPPPPNLSLPDSSPQSLI